MTLPRPESPTAGPQDLPAPGASGSVRRWAVVFTGLALVAAGVILYSTRVAPWAFSDSVAYLLSAQSLAGGGRLGMWTAGGRFASIPSPGYPGLLALLTLFGMDLLAAARWVGVAAFAGLIGFVGYVGARLSRYLLLGLALAFIGLVQPTFVRLYSGVMTDPLFITLSVISLLVLGWSMAAGYRRGSSLAGLLAGAATLTRLVGVALVPAGAFSILFMDPSRPRERVKHALGFTTFALLPAVAWQAVAGLTGSGPPRGFRLPEGSLWQALIPLRIALIDLVWTQVPWLARISDPPYRTRLVLLSALIALGVAGWLWLSLRKDPQGRRLPFPVVGRLAVPAGLFLASYPAVFALAYLFTDPTPDLDERTLLAPMIVPLWIVWLSLPLLAAEAWPRVSRAAVLLVLVIETAAVVPFIRPSLDLAQRLHEKGDGYTSTAWTSSGLIELVKALPPDTPLITNESAAVALLAGRPAYDLPELVDLRRRLLGARFGDNPDDPIERMFRDRGAALVLFDSLYWQLDRIYPGKGGDRLSGITAGLAVSGESRDGKIYLYPSPR